MATLTEAQVEATVALTAAYKRAANREAARVAALVALYYRTRVDPTSAEAVERWLSIMIPNLIKVSDTGAERAATYFDSVRRLEVGVNAPIYRAEARLGMIDEGVRKSLLAVGPYDYMNKMSEIKALRDITPMQEKALLLEAKNVTTDKLAAAAMRHAQAGGRQTVFDNAAEDKVALGWVRVTKANPCWFCAMLASRGIAYRSFKEGSFDESDLRFSGDGDAKVHDSCGCSLKPVYDKSDPLAAATEKFADMWSMWGAGGGDAALRFRRGYEHFQKTGDYLTHEQAARP